MGAALSLLPADYGVDEETGVNTDVVPEGPDRVKFAIDAGSLGKVYFVARLASRSAFTKAVYAFKKRQGLGEVVMDLRFQDERIRAGETPGMVGLKDGDVVVAVLKGGGAEC